MAELKHVAIIMDGNGRWAKERFRSRTWGHVKGASVVSSIIEEANDLKLEALTLFAFSTENWNRPISEVNGLIALLRKYIIKERDRILSNNIIFRVVGDVTRLPSGVRALIQNLESLSQKNNGLKLNFAFSYGGRDDIVKAVNIFVEQHPGEFINGDALAKRLALSDVGDVDLLIRTGGDQRISNFLLWQMAYAELYFSVTKWPEFTRGEFRRICQEFYGRERRFGAIPTETFHSSLHNQFLLNVSHRME